jgi:hypothetical protein
VVKVPDPQNRPDHEHARDPDGRWRPGGRSPNPGGRPRRLPHIDACRDEHGPEVLAELVRLALHAKREAVRRAACSDLADRFYGKPAMAILAAAAEVAPVDAEQLRGEIMARLTPLAGRAEPVPALPAPTAAAPDAEPPEAA